MTEKEARKAQMIDQQGSFCLAVVRRTMRRKIWFVCKLDVDGLFRSIAKATNRELAEAVYIDRVREERYGLYDSRSLGF